MRISGYNDSINKLRRRIKELRESKGLSQVKLVEKLQLNGYDIPRLAIIRIER